MDIVNLGRSGLRVSRVGLGCNNFGGRIDLEASRAVVDRAIEQGVTLFDTADVYGERGGSETALGAILGDRRKEIVLATKFGHVMDERSGELGASRRYLVAACEASLRRLRTDWIDLYQLHKPDPLTPMEETLRALDDLVRAGKVRYVGCSNLPAWGVADAHWIARSGGLSSFVSAQDEYSLLVRGAETELLPALNAFGMGLLPYFPLASGLLTGKYRRDEAAPAGTRLAQSEGLASRYGTPANWDKVERLRAIASERGRTMLEIAFAWLASNPAVSSVIAGATRPEQVDQNVAALGCSLSPEDLVAIDGAAPL